MRIIFGDGSFNTIDIRYLKNYIILNHIVRVRLEASEVAELNRLPMLERRQWRCDLINKFDVSARRAYFRRTEVLRHAL